MGLDVCRTGHDLCVIFSMYYEVVVMKRKNGYKLILTGGYQMETITDTHLACLTDKLYFSIYEVNSFCDLIA